MLVGEVRERHQREPRVEQVAEAERGDDEDDGGAAGDGLGDDAAGDGAPSLHGVEAVGLDVDQIVDGVDRTGQEAEDRRRRQGATGQVQVERGIPPATVVTTSLAKNTGAKTKRFFTHWCGRTVRTRPLTMLLWPGCRAGVEARRPPAAGGRGGGLRGRLDRPRLICVARFVRGRRRRHH